MSFSFRPAVRENVPLLIGLSGGTGSGKTYSAMILAKALAAGKRFAFIDTESGRAKAYAEDFAFDVGELSAPFSPERYADAVQAADKAGYPVIVIDSMSHEWAGDGGILDLQEEEFEKMGAKETSKMRSWIKPKMAHKAMVTRLLQVRAHVIMCFRAEPKVEMTKKDGKLVVQAKEGLTGLDGWFPICEKNLPFELTASFLLLAQRPGVPMPIKLMDKHRPFFPSDRPITESAGLGLAQWAKGSSVGSPGVPAAGATTDSTVKGSAVPASNGVLPAEIERAIDQAKTRDELTAVWREYVTDQTAPMWREAFNKKRETFKVSA